MLDYYRILNVPFGAAAAELKAAYIQRLKHFHPDIYKGADATEKTQKINEAYQVLKDPEKRAAYDRQWQAARRGQSSGGSAWQSGGGARQSGDPWQSGGAEEAQRLTEAEILTRLIGGFGLRQSLLQRQIEQSLGELCANLLPLREISGAQEAARRDFAARKQRLLAENTLYYQRFMRADLSAAGLAAIAALRQKQNSFISQTMDGALPQILAALQGTASRARPRPAPPAAQGGGFAPFWWGFGLSLFLSWLPLLISAAAYLFGNRGSGNRRFLLGAALGLALRLLFLAR